MKRFCFFPILLLTLPAAAQSLTPQVITTAANYFTGTTGSLSFTIGETAVGAFTSANGSLAQGFQPTLSSSNPLPLDFLALTAKLVDNRTQLDWTTTHEINTAYFVVQRSTNATTFNPIANIPAPAPLNPNIVISYQATDSLPLPGTDYYRIMEVDQNGQATYSPIVSINVSGGLSLMVYPNPAADQLHILINSNNPAQASIQLYNLGGQLLTSLPVRLNPGQNQFVLNLADYAKGMYIVKILGLDGLPASSILKK